MSLIVPTQYCRRPVQKGDKAPERTAPHQTCVFDLLRVDILLLPIVDYRVPQDC